ncbi:MAG: flagellar assembly protein FliW [Lachnospiraceae bacterium]|jgi:flagellar assembly factor FliW|nr:flagellar assembly protein FliW [Lachnospiraceae bacterium]
MIVNTKVFGEIELSETKVITFANGIIGYPELTKFAILHDEESGTQAGIRWMQSLEEPTFAMPVMDPLLVYPDYDPMVEGEWIKDLGDLTQENLLVLVTVCVPSDLKQMSVNLQGPIIVNVDERKAGQIIVDPDQYPVKFPIYDILKSGKAGD